MARRVLAAFALALLPSAPAAADATRPVIVPGAIEFLLPLAPGEDYRIQVYRPDGPPPANGWPSVYALDASRTFAILASFVRSQGTRPEDTGVLPMVVVGVEAAADAPQRRARDFTPPGGENPAEGGAEAFRAFLETTVKPAVARLAPLDPARQALFGHSYGGLFAAWNALVHPGDYAAFAALSPSLWWNHAALTSASADAAARARPVLVVTSAEYEETDDPLTERPGHLDRLRARRMVGNARDFAARLAAAGIPASYATFAGETHGSVIPAALARATRLVSHAFRSSAR